MENQTQTHGETTNNNDNQTKIQTKRKELLSPKAGYVQHTSPHYGLFQIEKIIEALLKVGLYLL